MSRKLWQGLEAETGLSVRQLEAFAQHFEQGLDAIN
jgi:hypothetical protein